MSARLRARLEQAERALAGLDAGELPPGLRILRCCDRSCGHTEAEHGGEGVTILIRNRSVLTPPPGADEETMLTLRALRRELEPVH